MRDTLIGCALPVYIRLCYLTYVKTCGVEDMLQHSAVLEARRRTNCKLLYTAPQAASSCTQHHRLQAPVHSTTGCKLLYTAPQPASSCTQHHRLQAPVHSTTGCKLLHTAPQAASSCTQHHRLQAPVHSTTDYLNFLDPCTDSAMLNFKFRSY
jgi:hypothetical protein